MGRRRCCCTCSDCNCCEGIATTGAGYTIYAHSCRESEITAPLVFGTEYDLSDTLGSSWFKVECLESEGDTPGILHIRITAWMSISCACVYNWTTELYMTCLPWDYTFVLHTDDGAQPPSEGCPGPNYCCGDITIRVFSYDCSGNPDVADCQACHFCVNKTLYANITPDATCDDVVDNPTQITLTYTSDCTWWSEVECWDDERGLCCYKIKLEGDYANNRYCDWYLSVYETDDTVIVERLQASSAVSDGLEINFPAFDLPDTCCNGQVAIVITD